MTQCKAPLIDCGDEFPFSGDAKKYRDTYSKEPTWVRTSLNLPTLDSLVWCHKHKLMYNLRFAEMLPAYALID